MYASVSDVGENCGNRKSLVGCRCTASRSSVPSGAINAIDQALKILRSNAIVEPSDDQLGLLGVSPAAIRRAGRDPSVGTTSSESPEAMTMRVPSGDHTGPSTSAGGGATPVAIAVSGSTD